MSVVLVIGILWLAVDLLLLVALCKAAAEADRLLEEETEEDAA